MAASPARYGLASVNVLELIPIRSLATTENLQRGFSVSSWHVGVTDTLKAIAKLVSSRRYTPPTAMRSFPYPFNNFTCCDLRSTLLYLHHGRAFELNMDRVFQKLKKFAHNLCTSSSSDKTFVNETEGHRRHSCVTRCSLHFRVETLTPTPWPPFTINVQHLLAYGDVEASSSISSSPL
ncbi:hypothetical protein ABKN59_005335 [Abortiporus biennis]